MCLNVMKVFFYNHANCVWMLGKFYFIIICKRWLNAGKTGFIYSSVMLAFSCIIDRLFYGDWILVQYNFLEFNVLHGGGSYYGTHPWHWYITQGYPVIMSSHLLPFIMGARKAKNKVLLFLILWTVFIYRYLLYDLIWFIVFNATFSNISAIAWQCIYCIPVCFKQGQGYIRIILSICLLCLSVTI
jgi:hypothetical protein